MHRLIVKLRCWLVGELESQAIIHIKDTFKYPPLNRLKGIVVNTIVDFMGESMKRICLPVFVRASRIFSYLYAGVVRNSCLATINTR